MDQDVRPYQPRRLPRALDLSFFAPNSKHPTTTSSGPSTIANSGLSKEKDLPGRGLEGLEYVPSAAKELRGSDERPSSVLDSTSSNTRLAGTPSPSFFLSLSIFAHRSEASMEASDGISKLGGRLAGAPNLAKDIVCGLACGEAFESPPTNGGDAGMVSKLGLTDAIADGGLCMGVLFDASLRSGGGLRVGFRTLHESVELTESAKLDALVDDDSECRPSEEESLERVELDEMDGERLARSSDTGLSTISGRGFSVDVCIDRLICTGDATWIVS